MDRLKALRVFVEIADQGSMSAAARSLGVVNSVVSKNLGDLENWLGKKLLYRSTRHVRLTQEGEIYLPACREILNSVERLSLTETDTSSLQGSINITAPIYLGQSMLTRILPDFVQKNSELNINLDLSDSHKNLVAEGIDIAFRVSQMPDSDFICRRLRKVRLKLVASPDYIRANGMPASAGQLRGHHCLLESEPEARQRWRFRYPKGRPFSMAPEGRLQANYGDSVKSFCLAGLGLAQLPDFFVDTEISQGRLVEILPEYALDNFYIHMLYHRNAGTNTAVKALVDFIHEQLGSN